MARKQLTPEQRRKIEQLLQARDKFNEKFWQEQREFEQRWKNRKSPIDSPANWNFPFKP